MQVQRFVYFIMDWLSFLAVLLLMMLSMFHYGETPRRPVYYRDRGEKL